MSTTDTTTTRTTLPELFSFNDLTEPERLQVAEEVGELVLQSTLHRLMLDLSEEQLSKLESVLEEYAGDSGEELMAALTEEFPQFANYFTQEASFFRSEVQQLLG